MKQYFVYILTNFTNTTLYVGVTNNIERRILEHKYESIEGFTKRYHLTKLVYIASFARIDDAIAAEKQIKGWRREKKNALINRENPNWDDLFAMRLEDPSTSLRMTTKPL